MIAKTRHIEDTKNLIGSLPAVRYVDPKYVYLPVTTGRCPTGELPDDAQLVNFSSKLVTMSIVVKKSVYVTEDFLISQFMQHALEHLSA